MATQVRTDWRTHVDQVLRARRYTWLAEGLSGEPPEEAVVTLLSDLMHLCRQENLDFEMCLAEARVQFEQEEIEQRFNAL